MTRVLSVTSECAPLVKTGGLADVAGALPGALDTLGDEVRTLIPGYPAVMAKLENTRIVMALPDHFGGEAKVLAATVGTLRLLVLEAPHLYQRSGSIYLSPEGQDWHDNPERFAALSFAAALIAEQGVDGWRPEIVHGHDWQAGLVPGYLHELGVATPFVFTIHNIAFHGNTGADRLHNLRLSDWRMTPDHFEYWGQISAMKAGLMGAARITTVSQTYAEELLTPDFGMGMDGVLNRRKADLVGIVNGIDTDVWNPSSDQEIVQYSSVAGKAPNKAALRKEFGLPETDGPLCVLISRLTWQKGIDLLLEALPSLLTGGGQLALLGSGEAGLEAAVKDAAAKYDNVAVKIGYDEALSHRMIAGGDAILVPSRFEPCGLTQLYGLRYGTLPVVALTGGLADTVINASPAAMAANVATGIQFSPINGLGLSNAFNRLNRLYQDQAAWTQMQDNAMRQAVSWDHSAKIYHALYAELAG